MTIVALFWASAGVRIQEVVNGGDIRLACRRLIGEVRSLRGRAAAAHREHVLRLDLDANVYWVSKAAEEEGSHAPSLRFAEPCSEEIPEHAEPLPRGVLLERVAVFGRDAVRRGRADIRFRENGSVERAWILLRNEHDRSMMLEISPATGRVNVHEGRGDEQTG